MPRHRTKKTSPLQAAWLWITEGFAALIHKKPVRPSHRRGSTAIAVRTVERRPVVQPAAAHSRRGARRRGLHIRNPRRIIIAGGALAVVAAGIVLTIVLTGPAGQQVAGLSNAFSSPGTSPLSTKLANITAVMPVSESVRLEEGVTATAVINVQQRLMDLGYMDIDETDGAFNSQTTVAVNHFKKQSGLTEDGVVDAQTYDLLMSDAAPYNTIALGAQDSGDDNLVAQLQQRLVELGYLKEATGYFGDDTEAAVKKFQKLNGLPEDGKIGQETRELLYSPDAVANFYAYGEQSDDILMYQQRLKKLGYLTTEPDGVFGADTRDAVRRFQEANGLIADGYIGPATAAALMSDSAQSSYLSIGSRGTQVENIQKRLKELGYLKGEPDGVFGSATDTAVRSFQYRNGLTVDGKVGARTLSLLNSDKAKKSTGVNITGANVESFIAVAKSKLGNKYVGGGKGPTVFDCSGFVYWCLNQVGINQSYMTSYTWRSCTRYTRITNIKDLKRGDVIVYYGHVAIALGNGYQIDASSHYGKIVERKLTTGIGFICAYRIF